MIGLVQVLKCAVRTTSCTITMGLTFYHYSLDKPFSMCNLFFIPKDCKSGFLLALGEYCCSSCLHNFMQLVTTLSNNMTLQTQWNVYEFTSSFFFFFTFLPETIVRQPYNFNKTKKPSEIQYFVKYVELV